MRIDRLFIVAAATLLIVFLGSCDREDRLFFENKGREVPAFSSDSAYAYLSRQVQFGPRNPGSEGHRKTKKYLMRKMREYAGQKAVYAQNFKHVGYEGDTLRMTNILASFNPRNTDRIMLCAHWDTRPRADEDTARTDQPIPGADDGASGVAVLLELARLFSQNSPPLGVDLILFDGEDYGRSGDMDHYFLGSWYWTNYPPVENYRPRFGILLDMVGGEGARFPKEKNSMRYAPALVNEIWTIADELGYGKYFLDQAGMAINDDHVIINSYTGIPMVDIIRHRQGDGQVIFAPYWHTHRDNMDIISKETLQAVGDVMAELIFNRL